ncbi:winged helix-turn-helix domain-containing protein [Dongia sp.]|uniref:winged helix-turn-helix domain-containing protein n=1 Tax=Dongia sp. TaxID=1977262 RepID=UPI0035B40B51
MSDSSIFLAQGAVRLFRRTDRPSRYWQAAFRRPGKPRPLVKSTGQVDLDSAKVWALGYLDRLLPKEGDPALLRPEGFARIRQEKRHVERELALRILTAYRADPLLSQRRLATRLDVSLAVINAYTARAYAEGALAKLDRPAGRGSGFQYVLTPAGEAQLGELTRAYAQEQLRLYRYLRDCFEGFLTQYYGAEIVLFGGSEAAEIARFVLDRHGITPAEVIAEEGPEAMARHAVKRHRRHGVLWLATLGDQAALRQAAAIHLPGMPVLAPLLPAPDV